MAHTYNPSAGDAENSKITRSPRCVVRPSTKCIEEQEEEEAVVIMLWARHHKTNCVTASLYKQQQLYY